MNHTYLSTALVLSALINAPALFSMDGIFCMERKTETAIEEKQKEEPTSLSQIAREQHEQNQNAPDSGTPEKNTEKKEFHSDAAFIANLIGQ